MSISFYGKLFETKNGNVPRAVQKAVAKTQSFAVLTLKAKTPVKTGKLRESWEVAPVKQGLHFRNPTPYAIYVEMGTRYMAPRAMLTRSLPLINAEFKANLARELGKSLAAKAVKAIENPGYDLLTDQRSYKVGLKPNRVR